MKSVTGYAEEKMAQLLSAVVLILWQWFHLTKISDASKYESVFIPRKCAVLFFCFWGRRKIIKNQCKQ